MAGLIQVANSARFNDPTAAARQALTSVSNSLSDMMSRTAKEEELARQAAQQKIANNRADAQLAMQQAAEGRAAKTYQTGLDDRAATQKALTTGPAVSNAATQAFEERLLKAQEPGQKQFDTAYKALEGRTLDELQKQASPNVQKALSENPSMSTATRLDLVKSDIASNKVSQLDINESNFNNFKDISSAYEPTTTDKFNASMEQAKKSGNYVAIKAVEDYYAPKLKAEADAKAAGIKEAIEQEQKMFELKSKAANSTNYSPKSGSTSEKGSGKIGGALSGALATEIEGDYNIPGAEGKALNLAKAGALSGLNEDQIRGLLVQSNRANWIFDDVATEDLKGLPPETIAIYNMLEKNGSDLNKVQQMPDYKTLVSSLKSKQSKSGNAATAGTSFEDAVLKQRVLEKEHTNRLSAIRDGFSGTDYNKIATDINKQFDNLGPKKSVIDAANEVNTGSGKTKVTFTGKDVVSSGMNSKDVGAVRDAYFKDPEGFKKIVSNFGKDKQNKVKAVLAATMPPKSTSELDEAGRAFSTAQQLAVPVVAPEAPYTASGSNRWGNKNIVPLPKATNSYTPGVGGRVTNRPAPVTRSSPTKYSVLRDNVASDKKSVIKELKSIYPDKSDAQLELMLDELRIENYAPTFNIPTSISGLR